MRRIKLEYPASTAELNRRLQLLYYASAKSVPGSPFLVLIDSIGAFHYGDKICKDGARMQGGLNRTLRSLAKERPSIIMVSKAGAISVIRTAVRASIPADLADVYRQPQPCMRSGLLESIRNSRPKAGASSSRRRLSWTGSSEWLRRRADPFARPGAGSQMNL
jgi:hypothetical protein